jgi:hypothetical protein
LVDEGGKDPLIDFKNVLFWEPHWISLAGRDGVDSFWIRQVKHTLAMLNKNSFDRLPAKSAR